MNKLLCIHLGEYGLEIYANEPADGGTYTHMCQYLIHYEAPEGWTPRTSLTSFGSDPAALSNVSSSQLGPGDSVSQQGLNAPTAASGGPLRDMYNYQLHAPPMGDLPKPYALSQYHNSRQLSSGYAELENGHCQWMRSSHSKLASDPNLIVNAPSSPSAALDMLGNLNQNMNNMHLNDHVTVSPGPASPNTHRHIPPSHLGSMTSDPIVIDRPTLLLIPRVPITIMASSNTSGFGNRISMLRERFECEDVDELLLQRQPYLAGVAQGRSPIRSSRSSMATVIGPNDYDHFYHSLDWDLGRKRVTTWCLPNTNLFNLADYYNPNMSYKVGNNESLASYQDTKLNYSNRNMSSISGNNEGKAGNYQKYNVNTGPPARFQNSIRFEPTNGSAPVGYVSSSGSSVSNVSARHHGSLYNQQQYDHHPHHQSASAQGNPLVANYHNYKPNESTANWNSGPIQREPPKEFDPSPLLDADIQTLKPRPQEIPSNHFLTDPVLSLDAFRRVDEHAVSISLQHQENFNQLIWQLIYARNITDELEKVRVIFLWLCTKDLHKMNFDYVKPDSPEEILMGIRTEKSTYAQIFCTLCRYAGLHCKLLTGYAKGAEYAPGMNFTGRQGQHSWNAVFINNVWRLIDCHWAARRLIAKRPSPDNVRYGLDMFYFLANPSQLIYTHFPHDHDWQLLRHPISLKEFENLAPVKPAFFKYDLDLATHRNAVIVSADPEVRVAIAFPLGAQNYLSFTFGFSFDNNDQCDEYRGVPLTCLLAPSPGYSTWRMNSQENNHNWKCRFGRQETAIRNHSAVFYVRPPRRGAYKLLIYVKQHNESGQRNGQRDQSLVGVDESSLENLYGAVCEYRLIANLASNSSLPPFPPCQSSSYGPNELAKKYLIKAHQTECTLQAIRGSLEVRFSLGSTSGCHPPRLMGKLKCTLVPEQALTRSLLQRCTNDNTEAIFAIFLPEAGEYGLEIYANDHERDGNSFFVVWQYIIVSDSQSPVRGLPTIPPTFLGPMPHFGPMGLRALSHPDPFIQSNKGEICIQLSRDPARPLRIMAQLVHCSHDVSEDCSQQVFQQTCDNHYYFIIRFPHIGFFKLLIYALPCSQPGESLPGVFNYLIEASQVHRGRNGQVMCFPQQFAQWKDGCYLHSPMEGILYAPTPSSTVSSDTIQFKVQIPKAHAAAVVLGDDWTHLAKTADNLWTGQICLKPYWHHERQMALCAKFDAHDVNYETLLEYQLAHSG